MTAPARPMRSLAALVGLGWFWLSFYGVGPLTPRSSLVVGGAALLAACGGGALLGVVLARRRRPPG